MKPFALGALWLSLPLSANAAILDFSSDACVGGPCSNTAEISQDYGDIAGELDVTYDGDTSAAGIQSMFWWDTGYTGLSGVGYSQGQLVGLSILFDALPGYGVTLEEFFLGAYNATKTLTSVKLTDLGTATVLYDSGAFEPFTAAATGFFGTWTSETALLLELGPDAWDVGIDNIKVSTFALDPDNPPPPPPVPLPASALLLLGALGAARALHRRA